MPPPRVLRYHSAHKKPAAPIPDLLELVGVPEDLDAKAIAKDFLGLTREEANRAVIEDLLRFYEREAPVRHSVPVTMGNIRAVWEEA